MIQLRQKKFAQAVLPAIAALSLLAPTLSSAGGADIREVARNSILGVHQGSPVTVAASVSTDTRDIRQIAQDSILGKPVGSGAAVVHLAGAPGQACNADTQEIARASILGVHPSLTC